MKAELKVNDKVIEVELTVEQLEALGIEEPKRTGWERAEQDGSYYYIDEYGKVITKTDIRTGFDIPIISNEHNKMYDFGNCFTDKKLAAKMSKRISLMLRMQRWADEHNDLKFTNEYHYISFDNFDKNFTINTTEILFSPFQVYFTSIAIAKQAIREFKDEIMEILQEGVMK